MTRAATIGATVQVAGRAHKQAAVAAEHRLEPRRDALAASWGRPEPVRRLTGANRRGNPLRMIQWKLAVVGLAALSSLAFVPNQAPSIQDPAAAAATRADEPSLEQRMKAMKRAFAKVKDFAAKGEGAAPLAEVDALLQNALAARNMVPELAADIAEADRAKWLAAYKQGMRDTVRSLLDLEQALEAGDKTKVKELAEALGKQQKEGHKQFKKD